MIEKIIEYVIIAPLLEKDSAFQMTLAKNSLECKQFG
jgi:hypothetical protein